MDKREELLKLLEDNYAKGTKLADNLMKTANLHQKVVDSIYFLVKRLIEIGDYEKAEIKLDNATTLINDIEVNNIATHIQDKLIEVMEKG